MDYSEEINAIGDRLKAIAQEMGGVPAPPPPPGPPAPPSPPQEYAVVVPAPRLTLVGADSMFLDGDHIGAWGQPGESVTVKIRTDKAMDIEVALDYALASESQQGGSTRKISVGMQSKVLTLGVTDDLWLNAVREWSSRARFTLPAGESVIRIENDTTQAWSNWADLFAVGLTSTGGTFQIVVDTEPAQPTPEPTPTPAPQPGSFDGRVGVDGGLMELINQGKRMIRVPSGIWDCGQYITYLLNRGNVTIWLDDGAILRGYSGVEGFGQVENFKLFCNPGKARIQSDASGKASEGIFIDSNRKDKTGSSNVDASAGNIWIEGVIVEPIPGTGQCIQRNGIGIWGADKITVINCEVHHAAGNAAWGFGSAGSLISIGHGRSNDRVPSPGYAVTVKGNNLHDAIATADGPSADRNGIILDLFHADEGGLYGDRVKGAVIIEQNNIRDVAGRGIQVLRAGQPDSPVLVEENNVSGRYAYYLGPDPNGGGESHPVAGIGGYGAGQCSSVIVSENVVATSPDGKNAYEFDNFDGGNGSGVKGSGNRGGPVVFNGSPTNNVPPGFTI